MICSKGRLDYNRERNQTAVLVDSIEPLEEDDIRFFVSIWQGEVTYLGSGRA